MTKWSILIILALMLLAFPVSAQDVVEVDFWYWQGGTTHPYIMDELVPRFHEEYPHIRIVPQLIPNRTDQLQKLLISASANDLPDLAVFDPIWLPQFSQVIVPFEELVLEDGLDETLADMNDVSRALGTYDGQVYLSTFGVNQLGLFYNKALFREAGIEPALDTWDDVAAAAAQLTQD